MSMLVFDTIEVNMPYSLAAAVCLISNEDIQRFNIKLPSKFSKLVKTIFALLESKCIVIVK